MTTRTLLQALGALCWPSGDTALADAKQKAVYHINYYGAGIQTSTLINIQNHINATGKDNVDIKVVVHGDGLSLLMYPDAVGSNGMTEGNASTVILARIEGLKQQGVQFLICRHTLDNRKIDVNDLYDVAAGDIVPLGVAHLAILQSQGYAYIKP